MVMLRKVFPKMDATTAWTFDVVVIAVVASVVNVLAIIGVSGSLRENRRIFEPAIHDMRAEFAELRKEHKRILRNQEELLARKNKNK